MSTLTLRHIVATVHPFSGGPTTYSNGGIDAVTLAKGPATIAEKVKRAREWGLGGVYIDVTPKVQVKDKHGRISMQFSFASLWDWAFRDTASTDHTNWARSYARLLAPALTGMCGTRLAYVGSPTLCPILKKLSPVQHQTAIGWTLQELTRAGFNAIGIDASSTWNRQTFEAWLSLSARHGMTLFVEAAPPIKADMKVRESERADWFDGVPVIQPSGQYRRWAEGLIPEIVPPTQWHESSIIAYGEHPDDDLKDALVNEQLRFLAHAAFGHGVRAGMGISHWSSAMEMRRDLGIVDSVEEKP